MRIFLAIDIPQHIKDTLAEQLLPIQKGYGNASWVAKENYHITTHFIGEVDSEKYLLPEIEYALSNTHQFPMIFLSGGVWIQKQLTFYVDFYRARQLDDMVKELDTAIDFDRGFKYIPHVTIGRSRIPSRQQYSHIKTKFENFQPDLEFNVEEVTMFSSDLSGPQPKYSPIHTFPLLKKG